MGSWISHIRIASGLLNQLLGLDAENFLFGNLAPDLVPYQLNACTKNKKIR